MLDGHSPILTVRTNLNWFIRTLLLFGVTSYADMPAYTGFRDLIHYHVAG